MVCRSRPLARTFSAIAGSRRRHARGCASSIPGTPLVARTLLLDAADRSDTVPSSLLLSQRRVGPTTPAYAIHRLQLSRTGLPRAQLLLARRAVRRHTKAGEFPTCIFPRISLGGDREDAHSFARAARIPFTPTPPGPTHGAFAAERTLLSRGLSIVSELLIFSAGTPVPSCSVEATGE